MQANPLAKTALAFLLALLLALFPISGFATTIEPASSVVTKPAKVNPPKATPLSATVTYDENFVKGEEVTFTYNVTGNTDPLRYYLYSFQILTSDGWTSIVDTSRNNNFTESNTCTIRLYSAGDYRLVFMAGEDGLRDDGKSKLSDAVRFQLDFTVQPSGDFQSVDDVANTIVAQCLSECSSDDYERALWLNDWIIDNTEYDTNLKYASAESVLARGIGTCEGYHAAYSMLLRKAGIETRRVDDPQGGHVWTGVKLNGQWYNVDTTWNDSIQTFYGIDHRHFYFALPTDLMKIAHETWDGAYSVSYPERAQFDANSYADNYFIRSGKIDDYTKAYLANSGAYSVNAQLAAGKREFTIAPENSTWNERYKTIIYSLVAYQLSQRSWGDGSVKLDVSYKNDSLEFKVRPETIPDPILATTKFTYDGTEKEPAVTLKDGTKVLVKDTDYTLSYAKNVAAGTASVTVKGKGSYTGSVVKSFTIAPASLSAAAISRSNMTRTTTGKALSPSVTVKLGNTTLKQGMDFYLTYNDSTTMPSKAGSYAVQVVGKGNYSGTKSIGTFKLVNASTSTSGSTNAGSAGSSTANSGTGSSGASSAKKSLSSAKVSASNMTRTVTGKALVPTVTVKYGSKTLKRGTDYYLTYNGSTAAPSKAGTYTVRAVGKGAYAGAKTVGMFKLVKASSSSASTSTSFSATKTYEISSVYNTKFVLDAAGKNPKTGANVSIWTKNGGKNQKWYLIPDGKGCYYIKSASNKNFLLDAAGKKPKVGSNISIWTNNGGSNQKWKIEKQKDGTYIIRSAANKNLVLDAAGKSPKIGANVSAWSLNGGKNQRWNIKVA